MNLNEFIKTALIDIVRGVEGAKSELDINEKYICPPMGSAYAKQFSVQLNSFNHMYYQQVEFDLAVTTANKSGGPDNASIKVIGIFEASIGGNAPSNNSTTVSRIICLSLVLSHRVF